MKVVDIKGFRKANGIQQIELADFLGVSNSFISQIERGEREIPESKLDRIVRNEKGWDTSLLYKEVSVVESKMNELARKEAEAAREIRLIPLLPFSAVAGFLCDGDTTVDSYPASEVISVPDFSKLGADCAIRVEGNSMFPKFSNGDMLAIRILHSPTFFQWGRIYVISTEQGCMVKRLFPDPNDEDKIICHSENSENYPDYKITKDDVLGVAIVVGHAGVE